MSKILQRENFSLSKLLGCLGLLMTVIFLAACGGTARTPSSGSSGVCPQVSVLNIAQQVYRFKGNTDDPSQLRFQAFLAHGEGSCNVERSGRQLTVNLPVKVKVVFGPKISKNDSLNVIITLFDKKSKVISKRVQKIIILDNDEGNKVGSNSDDKAVEKIMGREKYFSWNNQIITLLDADNQSQDFRITLAIQLNDSELNRIKSGDIGSPLPPGLSF